MNKLYYIVYLTTNKVNNKIYVGVHSTDDLNDGYLGSGSVLKQAIKKYTKANFKLQILYYCLTMEDAYDIEKQIVTPYFISNTDKVYNRIIGGAGGKIGINKNKKLPPVSEATRLKMSISATISNAKRHGVKPVKVKLTKDEIIKKIRESKLGKKRKPFTEETKQKMKISQQKRRNP